MDAVLSQLWLATVTLVLGVSAGWLGGRQYTRLEIRQLIDRLLMLDKELRTARASLQHERHMRLGALSALSHAEAERDSWAAIAHAGEPETELEPELEGMMIEVTEDISEEPTAEIPTFAFEQFRNIDFMSAYSEPPPRESDVRQLRRRGAQEEITQRAYDLWDAAGRPTGLDDHFWYLAEEALREDDDQLVAVNE
jgi:hypothetical protein